MRAYGAWRQARRSRCSAGNSTVHRCDTDGDGVRAGVVIVGSEKERLRSGQFPLLAC